MTDASLAWFQTCVERLGDSQDRRVWSVIVSLFGDLAQRPGDRLSGAALTRIIGPMAIRPEAIRVALHRLRKDGWLDSERAGRESQHFLTDFGRARSAAVTPRIYARAAEVAADWQVLIADEAAGPHILDALLAAGRHVAIARNVALGPAPLPRESDGLLAFGVRALSVPDWLRSRICPPDLNRACRALLDDLVAADACALPPEPPGLVRIATLRTLIVHRWRRVVLRHPDLPAEYFPADWPGAACRARVFAMLDRLPRPPLADLEAECAA